jgi:hypothetical protein
MSTRGLVGHYVTVSVVVSQTIYVPGVDEAEAQDEAVNMFDRTSKDCEVGELEITDISEDYLELDYA